MKRELTQYTPSGRFEGRAVVNTLVFGGLGAVILGALYGLVSRYNPFVYVSFIATLAFGFLLGLVATRAAQSGASRSTPFDAGAGLVVGFFGLWASWVVWAWLMSDASVATDLATSGPAGWKAFFTETSEVYRINLSRRGGRGAEFSSTAMLVTWAVEALAVLVVSTFTAYATSDSRVFNEATHQWAETTLEGELEANEGLDVETLRRAFAGGDFQALHTAKARSAEERTSENAWSTLAVELIADAKDPSFRLMCVHLVKHSREKDKVKSDRNAVVNNFFIPAAAYEQIRGNLAGGSSTAAA